MPTSTIQPSRRRTTFTGRVVSHAMAKTLVVAVERTRRHPKYGKLMRVTTKFHVHDPHGSHRTGDVVQFVSCRPISRTVRWIVWDAAPTATPAPVNPKP